MKLAEYLADHKIRAAEFGRRIGVTSESVRRYRDGFRIPEREVMARIVAETGGDVEPNDFYEVPDQSGSAQATQ